MHAARTQTLLKIRYKDEERLVEPYSLKYQQRRDGMEREYFFAYKLSGGESASGIKMFTADNMASIENTDTTFTPRFQIELSKAGEMPENRYLFDPNRPLRQPRARRSSGVSRMKYLFRCSSCRKQFTRSTHDSTLRPHKNKSGFPCYGTYGIYLGTRYSEGQRTDCRFWQLPPPFLFRPARYSESSLAARESVRIPGAEQQRQAVLRCAS